MNRKEKQKEISRVLPLLWNSYQHMYDVRVKGVNNSRNFLLIVLSFILVTSISLFLSSKNSLFFLPWALQLIALAILFKTFFIKTMFHWFEDKTTLENIENKEFDGDLFAILKTLENWTYTYEKETGKIIENSLVFIIASLYVTLVILARIYLNHPLNYLIYFIIALLTLILIGYYKKQPEYDYKKDYEKFLGKFNRWLSIDSKALKYN